MHCHDPSTPDRPPLAKFGPIPMDVRRNQAQIPSASGRVRPNLAGLGVEIRHRLAYVDRSWSSWGQVGPVSAICRPSLAECDTSLPNVAPIRLSSANFRPNSANSYRGRHNLKATSVRPTSGIPTLHCCTPGLAVARPGQTGTGHSARSLGPVPLMCPSVSSLRPRHAIGIPEFALSDPLDFRCSPLPADPSPIFARPSQVGPEPWV